MTTAVTISCPTRAPGMPAPASPRSAPRWWRHVYVLLYYSRPQPAVNTSYYGEASVNSGLVPRAGPLTPGRSWSALALYTVPPKNVSLRSVEPGGRCSTVRDRFGRCHRRPSGDAMSQRATYGTAGWSSQVHAAASPSIMICACFLALARVRNR